MARRSTVDAAESAEDLAAELFDSISLVAHRVKQLRAPGDLTLPERAVLARLSRGGPTTSADLARAEQITPQAMGNTLTGLERRGLVERSADQHDGRRIIVALTGTGREILRHKRDTRTKQVAAGLQSGFTPAELDTLRAAAPLLARLADNL